MDKKDSNPVFLVGAERSGTTLLRLMLDSHPNITWQSESEYLVDYIDDNGNWSSFEDFYEQIMKDRVFIGANHKIDKSLNFPDLVRSFLPRIDDGSAISVVGATCHRHFERLLFLWPKAKFIHILRDPRDVAKSSISMGWAGNVWYGVDRWISAEKSWEKLISKSASDDLFEIQYEELIESPEKKLTEICTFLGTDYHPEILREVFANASAAAPPAVYFAKTPQSSDLSQLERISWRCA